MTSRRLWILPVVLAAGLASSAPASAATVNIEVRSVTGPVPNRQVTVEATYYNPWDEVHCYTNYVTTVTTNASGQASADLPDTSYCGGYNYAFVSTAGYFVPVGVLSNVYNGGSWSTTAAPDEILAGNMYQATRLTAAGAYRVYLISGYDPGSLFAPGFFREVFSLTPLGAGQTLLSFMESQGFEVWALAAGGYSASSVRGVDPTAMVGTSTLAQEQTGLAYHAMAMIKHLNTIRSIGTCGGASNGYAVGGFSQGGIVAQAGLNKLCSGVWPAIGSNCNDVKHWFAWDSPLDGAVIPSTVQQFWSDVDVFSFASYDPTAVAKTPAAREMLRSAVLGYCNHDGVTQTGNTAGCMFSSRPDMNGAGYGRDFVTSMSPGCPMTSSWSANFFSWVRAGNQGASPRNASGIIPAVAYARGADNITRFTNDGNELSLTEWARHLAMRVNFEVWSWASICLGASSVTTLDYEWHEDVGGSTYGWADEPSANGFDSQLYDHPGYGVSITGTVYRPWTFIPTASAIAPQLSWVDSSRNQVNEEHVPIMYTYHSQYTVDSDGFYDWGITSVTARGFDGQAGKMMAAYLHESFKGTRSPNPLCSSIWASVTQSCRAPSPEVGGNCVDEDGDGSLGPPTPVTWTALDGVAAAPTSNSLTRTTSASGYVAGAVSVETIGPAGGYVEFTATERLMDRMLGLSSGNGGPGWGDIDFGIRLAKCNHVVFMGAPMCLGGSYVWIEEGATQIGIQGGLAWTTGDKFRVTVNNGQVTYQKNGVPFYTSTGTPTYPLLVDTSLDGPSPRQATISNVVIGAN
jgi:hypothetical protein